MKNGHFEVGDRVRVVNESAASTFAQVKVGDTGEVVSTSLLGFPDVKIDGDSTPWSIPKSGLELILPNLEFPTVSTRLPFRGFNGGAFEIEVKHGDMGHDHLNIYLDGKEIAHCHIGVDAEAPFIDFFRTQATFDGFRLNLK